jgi:hypothetical protein
VIWLPTPFRARITEPPTVRFELDQCEPSGIPRPTDEQLAAAEELLGRALPFNP